MQKYTKLAILGFLLPPFIVFYGIRQGAFLLLHGFFYTLTVKGLNITIYDTQRIGLVFFDPLVLLDPKGVFEVLGSYNNPIIASLDSTFRLMTSNSGLFFFSSFLIFVIGFSIHKFYIIGKFSQQMETEIMEQEPTLNPYSQVVLIFTLFFAFSFQIISFMLSPLENDNFLESFSTPIGSFFIFFGMIFILNNLEDNYIYVKRKIGQILLVMSGILLLLAWFIKNDYFFFKITFIGILLVVQYVLYKNILYLNKLKDKKERFSGSLIEQLFHPILINKNIPYYESTVVILLVLAIKTVDQFQNLGNLQFLIIMIALFVAFAGVLMRHKYGPLIALAILGIDFLSYISSSVSGISSNISSLFGAGLDFSVLAFVLGSLLVNSIVFGIYFITLYACYKEYIEITTFSSNTEPPNVNNLIRGKFMIILESSWVYYLGFLAVFISIDFLLTRSILQPLLFNLSFIGLIFIVLTLLNINDYNFEGKLRSIYATIIVLNLFFILDIFYLSILTILALPPLV